MAELYDCCDSENLTHEHPSDAVEEYLDARNAEDWPDVLHVKAWDHDEISEKEKDSLAGMVLERLFEHLSEDYGGEDEQEPSAAMGVAALAFVNAVCADFHVWRCSRVPHEDEWIPVAAWVRDNMPTWITDDEAVAAVVRKENSNV